MRLIVLTVVVAAVAGMLAGGTFRDFPSVRIRGAWLALAGVVLQFIPVGGAAATVLLYASFAALIAFAALNIRAHGFALILVGLALNAVVIVANSGMPVTRNALERSNQSATLADLVANGGAKHHLADDEHDPPAAGGRHPAGHAVRPSHLRRRRVRAVGRRMVHRVRDAQTPPAHRRERGRGLMESPDPSADRDVHAVPDVREAAGPRDSSAGGPGVTVLEAVLIIPLASWLCWRAISVDWTTIGWGALFFVVCIAAVDLIPIPAWKDIELSLSFPIMIGVAMLYSPPVAGMIVIIGSSDIHELRRETPFLRAMWNRSQMALAIIAASVVFHQLAHVSDPWWILVPAALAATVAAYAINAVLVALHASLQHGLTVPQVLRKMHGSRPAEFLASYIGLALFGVVIARFFVEEGAWSVVVFLAPLVFARQMYFQSRMMADRLAEQNELLTAQADRLEHLLRKESATVDQLRELNRMKGEFVAVVSHELRTPITAMIGYAKTLRQPQFADDAILREEFLGRMERQGNRSSAWSRTC